MQSIRLPEHRRDARRGSLYITVTGVAMIVAVIALSSMHIARLNLRSSLRDGDLDNANLLAAAAIEHAISEFRSNPNWLTDYAYNTEYPATAPTVNGGTFSWRLVDGGGVRHLDGIGRSGAATSIVRVDLAAAGNTPLACGLMCGGGITVGDFSSVEDLTVEEAPAYCRLNFINNWGNVTADLEAALIVNNGGNITGSQTAPAPLRSLPNSQTVFDYYVANGTTLGTTWLQNLVLSPFNNPFGATNPDGIYVINAGGFPVTIKDCRIVGTVVVLNASEVSIDKEVNWEPARPNFPALLVQGDIASRLTNNPLSEANLGINLNPPQTPFQNSSDTDLFDSYPSEIVGIIYCTGNLELDGKNDVFTSVYRGVVIAGGSCSLIKQVDAQIYHNPVHLNDPPPGFGGANPATIRPGTWRRISS